MLKVIGNALKRRKLASQLAKAENLPATGSKDQPTSQVTMENSKDKPHGLIIKADVLGAPTPVNALDCDTNLSSDIVFIDGGIPEIGKLLRELDPQAEIHILHQQSDGVDQIEGHLTGRDGLQAIHLFCHGDNGKLILGSGKLTPDTITTTHSKALSKIGTALAESGEILVYGCDFCGGTTGRAAAAQLSMLIGAEVAASPEVFEGSKPANSVSPKRDVNSKEDVAIQRNLTELSFTVPTGGKLDATAEKGFLHSAGLAGGTLKSVTDGSGASVKLNKPGVSRIRTHILPNGAELTQYTNGAFTYQAEADAGSVDGELLTCLAVASDHSLAKFTVSMKAIRPSAISGQRSGQIDAEKHATAVSDEKFFPITEQVPGAAPHHHRRQFAGQAAGGVATELSINIPDTSAGPIAETTTMVDAPLIFLQRNKNAISISGSENDIVVVSLIARNGTLSARPLKGAQVEGFNSVNLTISGSVKQINAALDGLRFVNSRDHHGPAELKVSAKYERAPDEATVSRTVAISIKSSTEVPAASRDEQSSPVGSLKTKATHSQAADSEKVFIAEFTALIGAVLTIATAGETMKLKEGDLTINRDGTFNFSLRIGYTSSSSQVTCFVGGQSADPDFPPKIMLNLARLPLQTGELFTGNVFSSDLHTSKPAFDEAVELTQRSSETQSEPAKENLEKVSKPVEIQPVEEEVQIIRTSAPVVMAEQPGFSIKSELVVDKAISNSKPEFDMWDVEHLGAHSLHFSYDRKGRQSAVTDTMQAGQITIDTYKREQTLFLDVNSTFDPRDHGKVKSYQIGLRDGSPYPDGMREIRNGFISIEASKSGRNIELKISALMQGGGERRCLVSVDGYSGTMKPVLDGKNTPNLFQRNPAQQGFTNGFASA